MDSSAPCQDWSFLLDAFGSNGYSIAFVPFIRGKCGRAESDLVVAGILISSGLGAMQAADGHAD